MVDTNLWRWLTVAQTCSVNSWPHICVSKKDTNMKTVNRYFKQDRAFVNFSHITLSVSNMFKLCEHGVLVCSPETGYILLVEFVFMFLFNWVCTSVIFWRNVHSVQTFLTCQRCSHSASSTLSTESFIWVLINKRECSGKWGFGCHQTVFMNLCHTVT